MVVFRDIKFGGLSRGKRNSATTKANVSEDRQTDPLLVLILLLGLLLLSLRPSGQTELFALAGEAIVQYQLKGGQ